jgi:hypothetical protein
MKKEKRKKRNVVRMEKGRREEGGQRGSGRWRHEESNR